MCLFYLLYDSYYYNPKYYYHLDSIFINKQIDDEFWEQLASISYFISKSIKCFTPTALLLSYQFLKKQQHFIKINEQKKIAELNALKNQLNPHFLFNTLNNLYILTLEKSDKAPDIIERLASILDYIIYRCNDTFVPLKKEIELLHNYIALEKIRYGSRINIEFKNHIKKDVKIAPLLLITFIENAFKHGVSQELNKAEITISINLEEKFIVFNIKNTKPFIGNKNDLKASNIGLKNVRKQLNLVYPSLHILIIDETTKSYKVTLKLKQH